MLLAREWEDDCSALSPFFSPFLGGFNLLLTFFLTPPLPHTPLPSPPYTPLSHRSPTDKTMFFGVDAQSGFNDFLVEL